MKHQKCTQEHVHGQGHGHRSGRGPSSYRMHDPEQVFHALDLQPGDVFLDLGCGAGDYSIRAAQEVTRAGIVYALDCREETIKGLAEEIARQELDNVNVLLADVTEAIPLEDASVDLALMATSLHAMDIPAVAKKLFPEIKRLVRSGGRLAILECKKEAMPFGPPMSHRIAPNELEDLIVPYGFDRKDYLELGPNYLLQFALS
jgi:ubiquinone/menaquinone biosynthesis C-methylase UbiE